MTQAKPHPNYRVLPLPRVQREAKKLLTPAQLREAVGLTKQLRYYPKDQDLSIESCGDGKELRIASANTPSVNRHGWLRAIFWVHKESRTIYVVDVFWKENK